MKTLVCSFALIAVCVLATPSRDAEPVGACPPVPGEYRGPSVEQVAFHYDGPAPPIAEDAYGMSEPVLGRQEAAAVMFGILGVAGWGTTFAAMKKLLRRAT